MFPIIEVTNLSKTYRHNPETFYTSATIRERISEVVISTLLRRNKQIQNTGYHALSDVTFSLQKGEVLGILGGNGAGKSTLLKILSRVTTPTSGIVKIRGKTSSLLEVGTGFHPELTGRENIFLNGAILGLSRHEIRQKFDEIVTFSGVENFIDIPIKRYSSGMAMRLAFSVAAHIDSELLILDEVLAVGDAAFQQKCMAKIDDIRKQHARTIIIVSHSTDSVRKLCTKAMVLVDGRTSGITDIETAITTYSSSMHFQQSNNQTMEEYA